MDALEIAAQEGKSIFSQVSKTASEDIHKAKERRLTGATDAASLKMDLERSFTQQLEAAERYYKAELKARNAAYGELVRKFKAGDMAMTDAEFNKQAKELQIAVQNIPHRLVALQTERHAIIGHLIDVELVVSEQDVHDALGEQVQNRWDYIDLLLSRRMPPFGSTLSLFQPRDENKTQAFRTRVLKAYGAVNPQGRVWCPIGHKYFSAESVKAAHIVRYNDGEVMARHIFMEPPKEATHGHIWSAENGMPMSSLCEKAFDAARFVLEPVPGESGDIRVTVLDKSLLKEESELNGLPWGPELDGRVLRFLNEMRPRKRYLYYSFATRLLHRQRCQPPGFWQDHERCLTNDRIWATPGRKLRLGTLRLLGHQLGHLTHEEAACLFPKKPGDVPDDEYTEAAAMHAMDTSMQKDWVGSSDEGNDDGSDEERENEGGDDDDGDDEAVFD